MSATRHLIVDGSNLLHAWLELRALLRRDRDAARARLIDRLAPLHPARHTGIALLPGLSGSFVRVVSLTAERAAAPQLCGAVAFWRQTASGL
ncbi:MAG: hypothetical protein LBK99_19485 [Opitutaceae bacterium]|nr:hypothetical protein [Opitutaceae bacterium]